MEIIIVNSEGQQENALTQGNKNTVWNALVVARERYTANAQDCRLQGYDALANTFEQQAKNCADLLETFEA